MEHVVLPIQGVSKDMCACACACVCVCARVHAYGRSLRPRFAGGPSATLLLREPS